MAVEMHWCIGRDTMQLGSCWDCPKCWKALEQSVELGKSEGTFAGDMPPDLVIRDRPHLIIGDSGRSVPVEPEISPEISPLPACHCSSCDPSMCAYCGKTKGKPGCTFCKIEIRKNVRSGTWHVWCSGCTWQSSGTYTEEDDLNVVDTMTTMIGRDHFEEFHRPDEDGHA